MKNIPIKHIPRYILLYNPKNAGPIENVIYQHMLNHKEIPILPCFEYLKDMEDCYGNTVESIMLKISKYRLNFSIDKYVLTHLCDEKIIKEYLLWRLISN